MLDKEGENNEKEEDKIDENEICRFCHCDGKENKL